MEKVRELLKNPLYVGIGAGLLGLIVGWFVIGWGIWPVTYYDAAPVNLRTDLQVDYLRMAIDSYAKTGDVATAKRRYQDLGPDAATYLKEIQTAPGQTFPDDITKFANALALSGSGDHHSRNGCSAGDPVIYAAHNGCSPSRGDRQQHVVTGVVPCLIGDRWRAGLCILAAQPQGRRSTVALVQRSEAGTRPGSPA